MKKKHTEEEIEKARPARTDNTAEGTAGIDPGEAERKHGTRKHGCSCCGTATRPDAGEVDAEAKDAGEAVDGNAADKMNAGKEAAVADKTGDKEGVKEGDKDDGSGTADTVRELKKLLEDKTVECEKLYSTLQRTAADFDNYRKRTAKEKETIYADASAEVAAVFLPVADNLERALESVSGNVDPDKIRNGIELIIKQLWSILDDINVKEIEALGQKFDPQLHNAVLHVEGEEYGENEVVEVLQKGYTMKGKILRHSMVKVAN